jgi:hypothetical protein
VEYGGNVELCWRVDLMERVSRGMWRDVLSEGSGPLWLG